MAAEAVGMEETEWSVVGREGVLVCANKQKEDGGENFIGSLYHGGILILLAQVRREARFQAAQIF